MKHFFNGLTVGLLFILLLAHPAYGAFSDAFLSRQVGTSPSSDTILKTDGTNSSWVTPSSLGLAAFSYLFPSNATTTGLGIYASTTIGAGTQVTGLTINGGATTTGNAFFSGGIGVGVANATAGSIRAFGSIRSDTNFLTGNYYTGSNNINRLYLDDTFQGSGTAGTATFLNQAVNDFKMLRFGGNTSSFVGLGVTNSSKALYVGLANGALGGMFGVGTSTPYAKLSIHANNGETNATLFSIASSTASATTTLFNVSNTGVVTGTDATNNWTGRISPTHSFALTTGTTTTWTASTTATAYSPSIVMPFSGTLKQVYCLTDASFLGVNVQVNGSNATPSYFVASTTAGNVAFTAGNTFSKGQKVLMNVGTTTTASTLSISCTFDLTETP